MEMENKAEAMEVESQITKKAKASLMRQKVLFNNN